MHRTADLHFLTPTKLMRAKLKQLKRQVNGKNEEEVKAF